MCCVSVCPVRVGGPASPAINTLGHGKYILTFFSLLAQPFPLNIYFVFHSFVFLIIISDYQCMYILVVYNM